MDKKLYTGIGIGFVCLIMLLGIFLIIQNNPTIEYKEKYSTQILRDLDKAYTPDNWETNGRYDWIENNKGIFNISHKSLTPIIELTSKNYEGDVMFFTGFNTNDVKPVGAWLFKPNGYKIYNRTYTCNYEFNNSGRLFTCFETITGNATYTRKHFEQKVDGGNPETAMVWWEEIDYWKPLNASIFHREDVNFQNNNRWYFKDFTIQANKTYKIKLQFKQKSLNTPSIKYWAGFVPYDEELSYKDNFIDAILNNKGIFVDPWTDSLRDNLISYYTFNDSQTSGTTSIDVLQFINGTLEGGVTSGITGKLGEAYDFDNTERVDLSSSLGFYTTTAFSVCTWINSTNGASYNFGGRCQTYDAILCDFRLRFGVDTIVFYIETGSQQVKTNFIDRNAGLWNHICFVYNGSATGNTNRAKIYINGTDETIADTGTIPASISYEGAYRFWVGVALEGALDEIAIFNKSLEPSDVSNLWNSGNGLAWAGIPNDPPTVTLHNPTVAQNFTDVSDIKFNCTVYDDIKVDNVSLYINNTINITNSSPVNNSVQLWTVTLPNGQWNWTCAGVDNASQQTKPTARIFNVSDQRDIDTDFISPVNNFNTTNSWVNFIYNATPTGVNATNTTLYVWFNNGTVVNTTFTDFIDSDVSVQTITNVTGLIEVTNGYKWNAESCADGGEGCTFAISNRTFDIDFNAPQIIVTYPSGTLGAVVGGTTLNLNWSIAEAGENLLTHIANCSYTYDGVTTNLNNSVCVITNTTTFSYSAGVNNIAMNVTDIFGLNNFTTSSWIVSLSEINQTFSNITTEGASEEFIVAVSVHPSFSITATRLLYNGTAYTGTLVNLGGQVYQGSRTLTIPSVSTDKNVSFKWEFILNDTSTVNSLIKNQTIQDLTIDDCGTNTVDFLNLFVRDEELQNDFNATNFNTTVEVDINLLSNDLTVNVFNYSDIFNQTNEVNICFSANLSSQYKYDTTLRYEALNYSNEYYHIQRSTIENSTLPVNITLFDLKSEDSTEFQITFKDSSFLIVEDALINIARQYVSEGVFKTVEIPKTDSNGKTVAHLVESDVKYNMIVTKNGDVLGTFNNLIAYCEDLASGSCFISLNAVGTNTPIFNYNDSVGIAYDLEYNKTSRILNFAFITTDGNIKTINLTAIKMDQIGNTTACQEVLVSSAGTITCTVPTSIGNDTLFINIYVDGDLTVVDYVQAGKPFDSGDMGYLFLIFMLLSFPLMLSSTKIGIIIGTILGFLASALLSFIEGGVIGFGASIMWLIIAGIILIYTLNTKRET